MIDIVVSQLDYIFFVYGLAFVLLASSIYGLVKIENQTIDWKYLGVFAILHGLLEWGDLVALAIGDTVIFKNFRLILMVASFVPLIEFARINSQKSISKLIYLPLFSLLIFAYLNAPLQDVNALARYSMALVGSVWSGYILISTPCDDKSNRSTYKIIGYFLIGYGFAAGLVVPKASFYPACVVNHDTFMATFGFAIQLLRATLAVGIAWYVWKLWRRLFAINSAVFGIVPENKSEWITAIAIFAVVFLGYFFLNWTTQAILNICGSNSIEDTIRLYRFLEIIKITVLVLILIIFFVYFQNENASKAHLDISQRILKAVFETTISPIFVKDFDGKYIIANAAFATAYGVREDELIGKTDSELPDGDMSRARKNDMLETSNGLILKEEKIICSTGIVCIFQAMLTELPLSSGGMIVGVLTDVTQLKEAVKKLQDINHHLEEEIRNGVQEIRQKDALIVQQSRSAAMGEMIGAIAHQWRQPLNAIAIMVQDISIAYSFDELDEKAVQQFVAKCMQQVQFMSHTIDDFRNFLKPDKKQENFFVRKTFINTLSLLTPQFETKGISIEVSGNEDAHVFGFPREFGQVVLNIINNARDALLDKSVSNPSIKVNFTIQDGDFVIEVKDNAGGVPESIIESIFDPYFTTKEQGSSTGIGLYISKTIIESHMNGKLTVANKDGGALFTVSLPIAD